MCEGNSDHIALQFKCKEPVMADPNIDKMCQEEFMMVP
jgi:hypothetical protein